MSGFDNSQPISDEAALKDVDTDEAAAKASVSTDKDGSSERAENEELGDATPGPR